MDLERQPRHLAQRLDDDRPHADVRHEVAVHHVHMNAVGAGALGLGDLLAQAGEVGGEDRRGKLHGHGSALPYPSTLCAITCATAIASRNSGSRSRWLSCRAISSTGDWAAVVIVRGAPSVPSTDRLSRIGPSAVIVSATGLPSIAHAIRTLRTSGGPSSSRRT